MSSDCRAGLLLFAFVAASGCADWERGKAAADTAVVNPTDAGAGTDGATADTSARLGFAGPVHRALTDGCARCHSANGSARSSAFILNGDAATDRQQTLKFVNTDSPAASRLLSKTAGLGHGGGTIYASGTPEYRTILDWITQGGSP
ncbi:MAG TPA: hypothetical protein VGF45_21495 [Polyangia bacterium]